MKYSALTKLLRLLFSILLLLIVISIQSGYAQPPGMPQAPSQAPIDGGLGIIAAGGAAYALRKLRSKKK
ncbi:hypothetical protein EP331_14860 [bacterium]|nr:MAG: hypothetical protein EP331_14860 [bacterium]